MPGLPQFGVHNNTTTPTQLSATENRYRRVNMTSPGSQTSLERPAAKRKRTDSLDVAEEFDVSRQISRRALSKLGGDKNHPSLGRTVLHFALRAREHAIYNRCQPSLCIKCRTRQASVVFEHDISPCVIFCEGCATDYDGPCPSCHGVVLGVTHMSKTKSKCMSCLHDYMNEEVFFVCGDSCRHLSCIGCAIKCARGAVAEKDLLLSEGGIRCPYNSKNDPHQNCTAVMTLAAIEQLYQISRSAGDLVITQCLAPGIHVPHPGPRPEQGNMSAVAHFACVRQWQSQHQKWLASQNTSERIPALTLREKEKLSTWSEGAFIPASRRMQCTRQGVFDVTDERGNRVRRECGRYFDGGEVKPFCAQKVECPYCSQESCRWCKGTDWHVGLNCVQAQIKDQLEKGLEGISSEEMSHVVIAYEPVWAIGTGKTASSEQAQEVHAFIRGLIESKYGLNIAESVRILYGGSVKPDNAKEIFGQPDIDGGLIGGASLKPRDFFEIIKAAR